MVAHYSGPTCPHRKKDGAVCGRPATDGDFCGHHSPEGRLAHAKARVGKTAGGAKKTKLTNPEIKLPTGGKPPTYDQLAILAWEFFRTGEGFSGALRSAFLGMLQAITNRDAHRVALIRARAEERQKASVAYAPSGDPSKPPVEPPMGTP